MTKRGSVLVVGGGVIGVCSAYYLARAGFAVTLVEQREIGSGSSWGSAGLIVPSHSIPLAAPGVLAKGLRWMLNPESPFYVRPRLDPALFRWLWRFRGACRAEHVARAIPVLRDLSRASLALYRELAALDGLAFGYAERGVLMVFRTRRAREEALHEVALLHAAGIAAKVLDAEEARGVEPSLVPGVTGGVLFPEDAQLIPERFVTGLARVTEGLGVRILRATEVLGFRLVGSRLAAVETTRGDLDADQVVLAAGAWSPALGRMLRLHLPVQPAKGYSLTCRRATDGPAIPLLLAEARMGVTPMAETLRFAGTLELAGLDFSINRRRVAALRRAATDYVRGVEALEMLEIWRGLRPCTPDGLPIIGRVQRLENLIMATGHAMIGVSLAPVTGKLVAQLAAGDAPLVDVAPLRLERFG